MVFTLCLGDSSRAIEECSKTLWLSLGVGSVSFKVMLFLEYECLVLFMSRFNYKEEDICSLWMMLLPKACFPLLQGYFYPRSKIAFFYNEPYLTLFIFLFVSLMTESYLARFYLNSSISVTCLQLLSIDGLSPNLFRFNFLLSNLAWI